jgi:8-oxo-dGTP diphosphatase
MISGSAQMRRIHVAAAAIFNTAGEVLLSRRPAHVHQGGLWEFPGGKLEPGEATADALRRELYEELGICPRAMRPLIRVHHDYHDRHVLLDVWRVDRFTGTASGREGQLLGWVSPGQLGRYPFPAATLPVIKAITLPDCYLITPEPDDARDEFLQHFSQALGRALSMVQLRAKHLALPAYRELATRTLEICRVAGTRLLLNAEPSLAVELGAHGVHLSSKRLLALNERPLGGDYLVGASCHNPAELEHACLLEVDFAVVSPVRTTPGHPGVPALGFAGLRRLSEQANLPVYALGGMTRADLPLAFEHGAQGIAAVRDLWN